VTSCVAQLSSRKLTDDRAAGRVFCTIIHGRESFAWTQNAGNLLAVVVGSDHAEVWTWWLNIHHDIGLASPPVNM
jgi:hypothetical protein